VPSPYIEATKSLAKNVGFIMGFRRVYRVEIVFTLLAIAAFTVSYFFVWGNSVYTAAVTGALLIAPAAFQYIQYRNKARLVTDKNLLARIPPPTVPLFTIVTGGALSAIMPALFPVALLNTLFIEDITVLLGEFDVVKVKRDLRVLVEPISRSELLVLLAAPAVASLISLALTGNLAVLAFPAIAYIMLVYSLILVPPEYRAREEKGLSLLEDIARRVPFLFFIYIQYYMSSSRVRLGKEAGYIGASYYVLVRKAAGLFTISLYGTLAATPILYLFMGDYAFFAPLPVAVTAFFAPHFYFVIKRSGRAGKINRNLLLILSYLAAMASVAEDFTAAMRNLKFTPQLAKMFSMDVEAEIYLNIYRTAGATEVAMDEYAETVPDDFYRDTVRTIRDIVEHEGYGAVFRSLVARLREFATRHIERTSYTFENIGGNIISVIVLIQTAVPIMMFLFNPLAMPIIMLAGGILSAFAITIIANAVLPDMPSEYPNFRHRLRRGVMVFSFTALALTLLEYLLLPDAVYFLAPLNAVPAFFLAIYYASAEDMRLNSDYLAKFPDLLILFSSAMARYNNVERALLELSQQATFTPAMRRSFQKLAGMFALLSSERLPYRGPYWYKYFMFLAGIASSYGITPRELYKTISEFMLEFKRFFTAVANFGRGMLFMVFIALVVMSVQVFVATEFLKVMSEAGLAEAATEAGISFPFPTLSPGELASLRMQAYVALMTVATLNGIALAKAISGTFRDGRWVLVTFMFQLLLLYAGVTTNFGIRFG